MRKTFLLSIMVLAVAGLGLMAAQPAHSSDHTKVPVIITFVDRPGPPDQALVRGAGGDIKYTYTLVPAIAASVPQDAIAGLTRNPRITRIDPDLEIHIADHSVELNNTWGVAHIGGGDAHHEGFQGGVRVAVLDTGLDRDHPDLAHDPGCSDATSYPSIHDGNSHGTHVAGTVAALKNQVGVVGAAPAATLCVFKVLSDGGGGSYSDVIKALEIIHDYNQDNPDPIRVANHSYGSSGDPGPTVKAAFDITYQGGVLHVGAAGNSGNPPGRGDNCIFPARWSSVIATAATSQNDNRASFSSTCDELELSAPGVSINSTMPGGGYASKSGTSMASPHVAGTAALALAENGDLANTEVRSILRDTAEPLGSAHQYGNGLVQALAAAVAASSLVPAPPPTLDGIDMTPSEATIAEGETQQFEATARYSDGSSQDVTAEVAWSSSNEAAATIDGNGLATAVAEGETTITAELDDVAGTASLTVTEPPPPPTLESIAVSPAEASIVEGETQQFTATGNYDDGSTTDLTAEVTWSSSNEAAATIDGNGLATAVAEGETTITAELDDVAGTASLTVTEPPPPPEEPTIASVESITYGSVGGRNQHLLVTVAVADDLGNPVGGASVSISLEHDSGQSWTGSSTTGSDGMFTVRLNNAPSGCYETTVTSLTAEGLDWDGDTPDNGHCR